MHDFPLDALVDVIDAAVAEADAGFPFRSTLIRVVEHPDEPDGFELGWIDLGDDKATEALLGFTAPPDWTALGTVAGGWAAPTDGPVERPSAHPHAVRARIVTVVHRSGAVAQRVTMADGRRHDEPGVGPGMDVLRRALGLATAPPDATTAELFAAMWLDATIDEGRAATAHGRRLPWPTVVRLHPAAWLLARGGAVLRPAELVDAAAALARVCGWAEVQALCVQRRAFTRELTAADAGWMDEGALSRWLLSHHLPMAILVERAAAVLSPASARQLHAVLADLGVDLDSAA